MKGLTAHQKEILKFVSKGMPNKEIAFKLGVTEPTIKNILYVAYQKMNVTNRTEAAIKFLRGEGN